MENLANVKLLYWSGKVAMDSVAHLPRKEMLVNDIAGSVAGMHLPFGPAPHFVLAHDQTLYYGSSSQYAWCERQWMVLPMKLLRYRIFR